VGTTAVLMLQRGQHGWPSAIPCHLGLLVEHEVTKVLPACSFTPPRAYPFTLTQFPLAVSTISAILLHVVFSVLHHRSELSPAPTYLSCPPTV